MVSSCLASKSHHSLATPWASMSFHSHPHMPDSYCVPDGYLVRLTATVYGWRLLCTWRLLHMSDRYCVHIQENKSACLQKQLVTTAVFACRRLYPLLIKSCGNIWNVKSLCISLRLFAADHMVLARSTNVMTLRVFIFYICSQACLQTVFIQEQYFD